MHLTNMGRVLFSLPLCTMLSSQPTLLKETQTVHIWGAKYMYVKYGIYLKPKLSEYGFVWFSF